VSVTIQGADQGDTTTIAETVTAAAEDLEAVASVTDDHTTVIEEVVADKGYHSNQVLVDLAALDLRPISRNRIVVVVAGGRRPTRGMPSTRIAGVSAGPAAARSNAVAANDSNGRTRISMKPAGCDGRICGATRTS
jgi:hypothetical protein